MYAHIPESASILLIDDEPAIRENLQRFLRQRGYRTITASDSLEALGHVTDDSPDIVLVDATAPGPTGVRVVQEIKSRRMNASIVVMSAYPTLDQSVQAFRYGAEDYVTKPFEFVEVAKVLERVITKLRANTSDLEPTSVGDNGRPSSSKSHSRGRRARSSRSNQEWVRESKTALVGSSRAIKKVFAVIDRIAPTDSSVLITGATGTGKELVALAIHERSRRASGSFVDINCSAIPETLIEAELFGHQRGAFTGAHETRRGLFEEASGGTIFLDEIDALDLSAQAKLLRVIQERMLRRVGGRENIPIDVRIISAANGDLRAAIAKGKFRADLFFRLRVVPLHLPTLRERDNDVALLINHFLNRHAERNGLCPKHFSDEAMRALMRFPWPGNVRELENAVEYALAIGSEEVLGLDDLPPEFSQEGEPLNDSLKEDIPDNLPLIEVERRHIIKILQRFGGHQIKTATALGIDRRTLYRKLKQYDLMFSREEGISSIK
ncbi:MAG TPA: sigma-54 dependent transcriptional regulator [Pyrinomonadaceae bacterium]|jgi:DNA-binding NtrC family response regulator